MIKKLFSNLKRMIYDRQTGDIIVSETVLSPSCIGFQHNQLQDDEVWKIKHKFNNQKAIVDVFIEINGGYQKVVPDSIEFNNGTLITITFSIPTSGFANIFFVCNEENISIP